MAARVATDDRAKCSKRKVAQCDFVHGTALQGCFTVSAAPECTAQATICPPPFQPCGTSMDPCPGHPTSRRHRHCQPRNPTESSGAGLTYTRRSCSWVLQGDRPHHIHSFHVVEVSIMQGPAAASTSWIDLSGRSLSHLLSSLFLQFFSLFSLPSFALLLALLRGS